MLDVKYIRDNPDAEPLGDAPVVRERLETGRMRVGRPERHAGDVEEVARGEPAHLLGKALDRVENAAAVVADGVDAEAAEFDHARDPGRPGARNDDRLAHPGIVPRRSRLGERVSERRAAPPADEERRRA